MNVCHIMNVCRHMNVNLYHHVNVNVYHHMNVNMYSYDVYLYKKEKTIPQWANETPVPRECECVSSYECERVFV